LPSPHKLLQHATKANDHKKEKKKKKGQTHSKLNEHNPQPVIKYSITIFLPCHLPLSHVPASV
jgi:hypothetical protein